MLFVSLGFLDVAVVVVEQLLNDSIIDFYLRYAFSATGPLALEPARRQRCHVFSSFFYQRLTTRPTRPAGAAGRKHPVEDDPKLSAAEKRHARVKSWTKKVRPALLPKLTKKSKSRTAMKYFYEKEQSV